MTDETETNNDETGTAEETNEVTGTAVRFVGDPSDDFSGPSSISMFGMEFPKGAFVGVEDENVIRKLRGHSHFEFQDGTKVEKKVVNRDDLPSMGLEQMKEVAQAEGVAFDADTTKQKLMRAIRQHRKLHGSDDN